MIAVAADKGCVLQIKDAYLINKKRGYISTLF